MPERAYSVQVAGCAEANGEAATSSARVRSYANTPNNSLERTLDAGPMHRLLPRHAMLQNEFGWLAPLSSQPLGVRSSMTSHLCKLTKSL